jgi:hypothetical protein
VPRVYEVTKGLGAGVVQGAARLGRPLVCDRTPKVCNLDVRGGAARSRAPARALAVTVTGWGSSLSGVWGAVGRYLQHRQALAARNEDVVWLDVQVPHTLRVTVHKARDHLQGCSREHHGHTHTRSVRVILVLRLTKRRARIKREDEPFASKKGTFRKSCSRAAMAHRGAKRRNGCDGGDVCHPACPRPPPLSQNGFMPRKVVQQGRWGCGKARWWVVEPRVEPL